MELKEYANETAVVRGELGGGGVCMLFYNDASTSLCVEAACGVIKRRRVTDTLQQRYRREHMQVGVEK